MGSSWEKQILQSIKDPQPIQQAMESPVHWTPMIRPGPQEVRDRSKLPISGQHLTPDTLTMGEKKEIAGA